MPRKHKALPGHDFPKCAACRHVLAMGTLDGLGWTCKAFPDGIPPTIVDGIDDHAYPFTGDQGIRFELAPLDSM